MDKGFIDLLVTVAPLVGNRIKEYFEGKKPKVSEVQILLLAQVLEQNKQVYQILNNHIQHEEETSRELLTFLRGLKANMIESGIIQ